MIKPAVVSPGEEVDVLGYIFGAPLVTKGFTWFPLAQLVTWLIMVREAGRLHPKRTWFQRMGVAALTMPVILGSEWCHNLAHAAVSKLIGFPADSIRISWGMPLLVYFDEENPQITPKQHITRALGGPAFNAMVLLVAAFLRRYTKPRSVARDVSDAVVGMNTFLALGGMLPIPYIDGGAILKWGLVAKGNTPSEADEALKQVNALATAGLGAGAAIAYKRRKRFLSGILAMFAVNALLIATGLLKEKE